IKKYVPKYFFKKPNDIKTILKPILYREGVGIGNDDFLGDSVFQEYIEQEKFNINCFYDGKVEGYLTLGVYMGEKGYIGTYNRFCDNKITDELAQMIPMYLKN
ncbi:MAG: hypothetical protein Q9M94_04965, partial [Candidatus Gracilibacteria bacterium]|nr:hypothetical protein [Candidatus Gracilibacteria bacterium]